MEWRWRLDTLESIDVAFAVYYEFSKIVNYIVVHKE